MFDMKKFVEWQDGVMDSAKNDKSRVRGCLKAAGAGAAEGVIWGFAASGVYLAAKFGHMLYRNKKSK